MSRKTVAIRGLDTDSYNQIFSLAKTSGKRVSDMMNEALKLYLANENNDQRYHDGGVKAQKIKNDGYVLLSKRDIMSLHNEIGDFMIETSGRLVFEKDVDRKTLDCIHSVVINGGSVEVPRELYPLLLLKSEIHGKLEKY
jgi:hypothetical protein